MPYVNKFKRTATPGYVPQTYDLQLGEIVINTHEGLIYTKKDDGVEAIVQVGAGGYVLPKATDTILGGIKVGTNLSIDGSGVLHASGGEHNDLSGIQGGTTDEYYHLTSAQHTIVSNTSGTNSGDQTSIVGITGTKSQFNTAVTDGDILYDGDAPAETTTSIGTLLNSAINKTTPVDADKIGLWNSVTGLWNSLSWANLKATLALSFALLAGKAGGQMIVGDTASGGHLTLKATSHATQGKVRIDNGAIIREVASIEYVQATNGSMFTNGLGGLGDNTGMSAYAYDTTDVPASVGVGSFRINISSGVTIGSQRIPIDSEKDYALSIYAKSGDVGGGNYNAVNKQYLGIAMYDIDNNLIRGEHGIRYPTSAVDTTLAAALNPGDTTVTLTSASGWFNGAASGNNRQFCWFGYSNSKGFTYPDYTYTRNVTPVLAGYSSAGAWPAGGISGNVITLTSAWTGPALPIGTVIRPVASGANYMYSLASNITVPNAWTRYSATIGGIPPAAPDSAPIYGNFRHGTATISLLHLVNYHGAADNNVRLAGISVSPISRGNLESRIGIGETYKHFRDSSLPENGLAVEGNSGFGTTQPSAKIHALSTTEQLRLGYDAANYYRVTVSSAGVPTHNATGGKHLLNGDTWLDNNATAGVGVGPKLVLSAKSSTTDSVQQGGIASQSVVLTHATRTNRVIVSVSDYAASREGFRCEADGTQIKTSVNGVAAVARAAALTAEIPGDATRDELRLTELYNACKAFGIIN